MNARKSRVTGSYIAPRCYIKIESCICLACTYNLFENSVPVNIKLKPSREDQKTDQVGYYISGSKSNHDDITVAGSKLP